MYTLTDTIKKEWVEDTSDTIAYVETLKESIQPYDQTDTWDLAKRITNPYELIYTTSSRLPLPKSTCCLQPLSRSFFKMVEILTQLSFFDRHRTGKLKSLHLCEGPGGFLEAFLHMAKEKNLQEPSVYAMTLKSTHTIIPGWKRATTFLQKHKNIHILYGPTRTGNIYEAGNQEECVQAVGKGGATLVTADGGFDFRDDFYAQEKAIFRLIVSSALTAIRAVAIGGDIVLKFFDCHSQATRDLVAILGSCFQQWTLYKPVTSRPCNSEWYFLGKSAKFQKMSAIPILTSVRDILETETLSHILLSNPLNETIRRLQHNRTEKQVESLKKVLTFCKEPHTQGDIDTLWNTQRRMSIQWCYTFHMPTTFRLQNYPEPTVITSSQPRD